MSFDLARLLRGIPMRDDREAFVRQAKTVLARILAGRRRGDGAMQRADTMACYEHLGDLAREHELLTDVQTHDGFPRLVLTPPPSSSGASSPAFLCVDAAPFNVRRDRSGKREALA